MKVFKFASKGSRSLVGAIFLSMFCLMPSIFTLYFDYSFRIPSSSSPADWGIFFLFSSIGLLGLFLLFISIVYPFRIGGTLGHRVVLEDDVIIFPNSFWFFFPYRKKELTIKYSDIRDLSLIHKVSPTESTLLLVIEADNNKKYYVSNNLEMDQSVFDDLHACLKSKIYPEN